MLKRGEINDPHLTPWTAEELEGFLSPILSKRDLCDIGPMRRCLFHTSRAS